MILRRIAPCVLALVASFIMGGSHAQTPKAPTSFTVSSSPISLSVAGLHVSGNLVLNSQGQAVQLRGVNKAGTEYMCLNPGGTVFDGPADSTTITVWQSWGINIVRLPINEDCWLGINGMPNGSSAAAYQTAILNFIDLCGAANIAIIFDLQWAAPSTTVSNNLLPMPDLDHAPAFWTSAGNALKTRNWVVIDPFNEPYPDNNQDTTAGFLCLRDGGTCPGVTYQAAGMQLLVNTIRATGATNIIIIPGIGFANAFSQWLTYKPTDTLGQLGASWHNYATQGCTTVACWDSVMGPVAAQVPLFTGEIGESDCQAIYINPAMAWLDSKNAHYLAWAWNPYDCSSFPAVISSYDGTPTSFGIDFRNHLLALAGKPIPTPPVIPFFNNAVYPFGLLLGANSQVTATDATVYFPDTPSSTLATDVQFFVPYTTTNTITGVSVNDQQLYKTGRVGAGTTQTINVQNGNYTVILGMSPTTGYTQTTVNDPSTASLNNEGEFGQDQFVQDTKVGTCVWSPFSGTNTTPYTAPTLACPGNSTTVPTTNAATTVSYNVNVYNQKLKIQVGAAFGGGRKTILNTIKVIQNSILTVPATPTGLGAIPGNVVVNLSWTAASGATTYNIYRATTSRGFYRQIAIATTTTYSDTTVSNGKTYYYLISSVNAAGSSGKTTAVSATPALPTPSPPTGVIATPGNTQVSLSWTSSNGAASYNIKRSITSGSGYSTVGTPTTTFFIDTGRTNGTTYYYVITAVNATGESGNSSQVSATPSTGGGTGVWSSVTPGGINLTNGFGNCFSFGNETVVPDPSNPGHVYAQFHCQGVYKSTDYGQSWVGPINTGVNGSSVQDCAGGITVSANPTPGGAPTIYESCIRGSGIGFWKSVNGGVDWTKYSLAPPMATTQDVYRPKVDPYNRNHLLMTGHEQNYVLESTNGGVSWSSVTMNAGMLEPGGTAFIFFIDTGNSTTTAQTWLWLAQETGGTYGTWRTSNAGSSWTKVDNLEHPHGASQIYQPGTSGSLYITGTYSVLGNGVLHSNDYGQTWTHYGLSNNSRTVVWASATKIYAAYGWPIGNGTVDPHLEVGTLPGTGTWTEPGTPGGMFQGPSEVAVMFDGAHYVFLSANFNAGLWRYVEP